MKHLFLLRHAKSSWADDSLRDRDRPLNARGKSQLEPLARALAAMGAFDGNVYCSDAARARATLDGVLPSHRMPARVQIDNELYTFDGRRLADWLKQRGDEHQVLIVGHNPALLELAQWLLKQPPEQLPTASFLHIRLSIDRWDQLRPGKGKLMTLLTPPEFSYAHFARKLGKKAKTGAEDPGRDIPEALLHQARRLHHLERGVILGLDPEFLHQYRIAIRRSRAIGESVEEAAGDRSLAGALAELKGHARATGPLRDLHVLLEDLPELCCDNQEIEAALRVWFEREAAGLHRKLVKRLQSRRYRESLDHWYHQLDSRAFRKLAGSLRPKDIRKAVGHRIAGFNRRTAELMHTSPDEDIHRLRKQLKRIRYLMELDSRAWRPALKTLKDRQALYGDFQDLHVQIDLMDRFGRAAPDVLPAALAGIRQTLVERKAEARKQILALGGLDGATL